VEYYRQLQAVRETESNHKGALDLQRIYVLNEYKQRHIGKLLLEKAIRIAQDEGATYLWLGVWEHNTKAIAFYLKQGFVVSGTHHFILGSDTQTDHRMLFFTRLIFWVFSFDLIARYLEKALIIRVL
jgi:ribosomal protein S18 acetylase RimI-like enzyme